MNKELKKYTKDTQLPSWRFIWCCLPVFPVPLLLGPYTFEVMWLASANEIKHKWNMSLACRRCSSVLFTCQKWPWWRIQDRGARMSWHMDGSCWTVTEFHQGLHVSGKQSLPVLSHWNLGVVSYSRITLPILGRACSSVSNILSVPFDSYSLGPDEKEKLLFPRVSDQLHSTLWEGC